MDQCPMRIVQPVQLVLGVGPALIVRFGTQLNNDQLNISLPSRIVLPVHIYELFDSWSCPDQSLEPFQLH